MSATLGSDFPSGRLMFQPDTENIHRCVDVAIMRRPTVGTLPVPHSKRAHTFRTACGDRPAARARLGSVSFVSFNKHSSVPSGLIAEHMPELCPACIKDGLCHPRLDELGGAHIANDDQTILTRDPCRLLVKMVPPCIGDLGVNSADSTLSACTLRCGKRRFVATKMLESRNFLPVAKSGKIFQPQVNTDHPAPGCEIVGDFALKNHIPAPPCVLHEAARLKPPINIARLPEAESTLEVNGSIAGNPCGTQSEWRPAQGALGSEAGTEAGATSMLISGLGELATDLSNGIGMEAESGGNAGREVYKVKCRWPAHAGITFAAALRFSLRSHAEIPNLIAGDCVPAKSANSALDAVLEADDAQCGPILPNSGLVKSASSDSRPVARSLFVSSREVVRNALSFELEDVEHG